MSAQATAAGPQPTQWDQTATAWFDQPGAKAHLSRLRQDRINAEQAAWIGKFIDDGYFVVNSILPDADLDAVLDDVRDIWDTDTPRATTINRVVIDGQFRPSVPHAEIIALPTEQRRKIRRESNFTLGDIHLASDPVRRVFNNPRIREICSVVFDGPAETRNSLYFEKGSQQDLHVDTAVFHVFPRNNLIGVWIALEDINPDCGPLVYYPGSHKEPLFPEFTNYPQTNLRSAMKSDPKTGQVGIDSGLFERNGRYIDALARKYTRKQALLKKGDALFWHAMIIHGGDKLNDPALTRKSLVLHVMRQGTDRQPEMHGPFNW